VVTLAQEFFVEYVNDQDRGYVVMRLKEAMSAIGIYGGTETYSYEGSAQGRAVETNAAPAKRRRKP